MNAEKEIERKLLKHLGLDVNHDNYVIELDTGNVIAFSNKFLKYSYNYFISVNKDKEVYFNPIGNLELVVSLLSYYLNKLDEKEGIYYPVFFTIKDDTRIKNAVVIKNHLESVQTNFYNKINIAYIEAIFKVKNRNIDFSYLDGKVSK